MSPINRDLKRQGPESRAVQQRWEASVGKCLIILSLSIEDTLLYPWPGQRHVTGSRRHKGIDPWSRTMLGKRHHLVKLKGGAIKYKKKILVYEPFYLLDLYLRFSKCVVTGTKSLMVTPSPYEPPGRISLRGSESS
ncbi:unnamed protein product [Boreogadus saida]